MTGRLHSPGPLDWADSCPLGGDSVCFYTGGVNSALFASDYVGAAVAHEMGALDIEADAPPLGAGVDPLDFGARWEPDTAAFGRACTTLHHHAPGVSQQGVLSSVAQVRAAAANSSVAASAIVAVHSMMRAARPDGVGRAMVLTGGDLVRTHTHRGGVKEIPVLAQVIACLRRAVEAGGAAGEVQQDAAMRWAAQHDYTFRCILDRLSALPPTVGAPERARGAWTDGGGRWVTWDAASPEYRAMLALFERLRARIERETTWRAQKCLKRDRDDVRGATRCFSDVYHMHRIKRAREGGGVNSNMKPVLRVVPPDGGAELHELGALSADVVPTIMELAQITGGADGAGKGPRRGPRRPTIICARSFTLSTISERLCARNGVRLSQRAHDQLADCVDLLVQDGQLRRVQGAFVLAEGVSVSQAVRDELADQAARERRLHAARRDRWVEERIPDLTPEERREVWALLPAMVPDTTNASGLFDAPPDHPDHNRTVFNDIELLTRDGCDAETVISILSSTLLNRWRAREYARPDDWRDPRIKTEAVEHMRDHAAAANTPLTQAMQLYLLEFKDGEEFASALCHARAISLFEVYCTRLATYHAACKEYLGRRFDDAPAAPAHTEEADPDRSKQ